jgi:hypothetical protein
MPSIKRGMMGAAGGVEAGTGAVKFDGSTYLERGGDLTGNSDGDYCSFSFWFRYDADDNDSRGSTIYETDGNHFKFVNSSNGVQVEGREDSPSYRVVDTGFGSGSMHNDTTNWHHVCGTVDGTTAGNNNFFVDDSASTIYRYGRLDGGDIDFTQANHTIGASEGGSPAITMSIWEFWVAIGVNLQMNTTSNRRKFINADLTPVDLGSDGSTPTGTAPIIYLSGTPDEFIVNKGTGGNFSVTAGALIDINPPTEANAA